MGAEGGGTSLREDPPPHAPRRPCCAGSSYACRPFSSLAQEEENPAIKHTHETSEEDKDTGISDPVAQRSRCSSLEIRGISHRFYWYFVGPSLADRDGQGVRGVRNRHDFMFIFESQSLLQRSSARLCRQLAIASGEQMPTQLTVRRLPTGDVRVHLADGDADLPIQSLLQRSSARWHEHRRQRLQLLERTKYFRSPSRSSRSRFDAGVRNQYPRRVKGWAMKV
jgi:hypothetical protein